MLHKSLVWSLYLVSFLVRLRTYQHPFVFGIRRIFLRSGRNQPINKPTSQRANLRRKLSQNASRRPSACLAIPALTASLDSITDTLNCNCDCAYANEFLLVYEDLYVDKLMTSVQEAIGLMRGRYFGWKAVRDSNPDWFTFYPSLWNSHNELQLMLPS